MALQSSGQISTNNINIELGKAGISQISLNDTNARTLAGITGNQSKIKFSDFYGKSSYFDVVIYITTHTPNFNLRNTLINSYGWNGVNKVRVILEIEPGIYVYSNDPGKYALSTGSGYPSGSIITICNNGYIIGAAGSAGLPGTGNQNGFTGGAGGPSMYVQTSINLYNNGAIAGGGGGGGGGGGATFVQFNGKAPATFADIPGGSGGNGAGGTSSSAGTSGSLGTRQYYGKSVSNYSGDGGNGGNWGSNGTNGTGGSTYFYTGKSPHIYTTSGGAGGAAGNAIIGAANITWRSNKYVFGYVDAGMPVVGPSNTYYITTTQNWTPSTPMIYISYPCSSTFSKTKTSGAFFTAGTAIPITVGGLDQPSVFGPYNVGKFADYYCFTFNGVLRLYHTATVSVFTYGGQSYNGTAGGSSAWSYSDATGLYYYASYDGNETSWEKYMTIDTMDRIWAVNGGLLYNVYIGYHNGRSTLASITEQPSPSNTYRFTAYEADWPKGDDWYNYGVLLKTNIPFKVDW